jgi:hypothetical protein
MCDTLVALGTHTADGAVWFAKNSDREPGEAQLVEVVAGADHPSSSDVRCTYLSVPQAPRTHTVILSRPFWMWGAEMGVNEHGVAIGNEAVFTRIPVHDSGLTGMDLLRLALERGRTADEALDVITDHLARFPQGGSAGYRQRRMRYHNSFIIADRSTAWVLETAGRYWAAERVRGTRTISNVLTIRTGFDRIADGAVTYAREQGWSHPDRPFDFAAAFGDPVMRPLTGGEARRRCTNEVLRTARVVDGATMRRALRDHGGSSPTTGLRSNSPCAHASWLPTRLSAQTTGSMVSRLGDADRHWLTGTSAPCISVFKSVPPDPAFDFGPAPGAGFDESLFWRHERLHRAVLRNYEEARARFDEDRLRLEESALDGDASHWETHRHRVVEWWHTVRDLAPRTPLPTRLYWRWQNVRDHV